MSIEEAQQVWNGQQSPANNQSATRRWIADTRRRYLGWIAFLTFATGMGIFVLVVKAIRTLEDSQYTLTNSWVDLLVGLIPITGALVGIGGFVHHRREHAALAHNTTACVDFLIRNVRAELAESRKGGPILMGIAALLVVLSKWQSVSYGLEATGDAIGSLVAAGIIFAIAFGFLFVRHHNVLKPRLAELQAVRETLERD